MTSFGTHIVIIGFVDDVPSSAIKHVLAELGFSDQPDPRWRLHHHDLLTVETKEPFVPGVIEGLTELSEVRRVISLSADERLHAPRPDGSRSQAHAHPVVFGERSFGVIAGPCSVESERQICEIAMMAKEAGAVALRGGTFKPRTTPYKYGGLGEKGLHYLARAREVSGLPVVTEALDLSHLDLVAEYADVIQIGSRNMHNFELLLQSGRHPTGKPVLLKRGFGSTVDELLFAAEYVLLGRVAAGHDQSQLMLCERGIRTFEQSTRFSLDVGAIPVIKERTHLPLIVDPSHPAGYRRFVAPLARAAVAAGADGLLVEIHTDPDVAWCDGAQSLGPNAFSALMGELRAISSAMHSLPPTAQVN